MSAMIDGTMGLVGTADDGDVPSDALGIGFSNDALELAAADEELSELELAAGGALADGNQQAGDVPMTGGLPDEPQAAPTMNPATLVGADDGDVGSDALGLGFTDDELRLAEEDDELHAVEGNGSDGDTTTMPDEVDPRTAVSAPGELVDQPTAAPSRKVKAAGLGGILGAIPAPILSLLDLVQVSDTVVGAISAALTLLGSLAAAYLARERVGDGATPATTG
jgi:hypothetical protein